MRILFLSILLLVSMKSFSQANGYSLEFDSTIVMSLDTIPHPGANTTRTKSFTVPSGKILKINSGYLRNFTCVTNPISYVQRSSLIIGTNVISPVTNSAGTTDDHYFLIRFTTENAIWVNSGTTVTIKFQNTTSSCSTSSTFNGISECWIGGVIFKKIPN